MNKIFLFLALFVFDAHADKVEHGICGAVRYALALGGPLITIVIIGAALLAIFGKIPWHALIALCVFTGIFFNSPKITKAITGKHGCCMKGEKWQTGHGCQPIHKE